MPRPPRAPRDELLDRLIEHLVVAGLGGLAFRPLAAAIGASTFALSYHFGDRAALVAAIVERLEARQRRRVRAALQQAVGPGEAILAAWASMREHLGEDRLLFEVIVTPGLAEPAARARITRAWIGEIARPLLHAGFSPERATLEGSLLYAQLAGLQLDLLSTGDLARVEAAVSLCAEETARRWR